MRRAFVATAYAAALTSTWTSVQFAGLELGDLTLGLAFVLSVVGRGLDRSVATRFPLWSLAPAVTAIGLVWYNTVLLGQPLTEPVDVLKLGAGVAPTVFLTRVITSSAVVAALLFNLVTLLKLGQVLRLLGWYVAGLCVSAAYAALQAAKVNPFQGVLSQVVGMDRYPGLSTHPNALAQSAVLAACVVAGLPARSVSGQMLRAVAGLTCAYAVLLSGSRAGLIAMLLIILALTLRAVSSRSQGPLRLALAEICVTAFVYGTIAITSITRLAGDDSSADESDGQRAASIATGFHLFTASPFTGSGLGIWLGESVPLILLSSGGLVLFAAYGWFIGRAAFMAVRSGSVEPGLRWTAALTLCSLTILWVLNNDLFERYTLWPILTLAFLWQAHERRPASDQLPTRAAELDPKRLT